MFSEFGVIFSDGLNFLFNSFGDLVDFSFTVDVLFGLEYWGMIEVFFEEFLSEWVTEEFNVLDKLFAVLVFAGFVELERMGDGCLFGI